MSKIKYCFSCHDQMMFQLFGQSGEYYKTNYAQNYLDEYLVKLSPIIECELCGSKTKIIRQADGKWREIDV